MYDIEWGNTVNKDFPDSKEYSNDQVASNNFKFEG